MVTIMKTLEYHTEDKSAWGAGPWMNEPDKRQWQDPTTGLPCLIVRNRFGALCGYVGVAPGHPFYGIEYSECLHHCGEDFCEHSPSSVLEVHGEITYAAPCQSDEQDVGRTICHLPEPGEAHDLWWFGFDCAHAGDVCPGLPQILPFLTFPGDEYRDLAYVEAEVTRLAAQLQRHAEAIEQARAGDA